MADNKTTPTPAPGLDLDAAEKRAAGFPGAHAYRGLLVKARAEIARLTAEHRAILDAEIAESDQEIERLTGELAAARTEVDCGQDGPCAKAPGCARHWQERNRELVEQLAAARAVPADVEAALSGAWADGYDDEFERFERYCDSQGFKKSTLIARLIREHLDGERFQLQKSLPLTPSGAGR